MLFIVYEIHLISYIDVAKSYAKYLSIQQEKKNITKFKISSLYFNVENWYLHLFKPHKNLSQYPT